MDWHIQKSIQQGIFMYKRVNDVRFIKGKQEAIWIWTNKDVISKLLFSGNLQTNNRLTLTN